MDLYREGESSGDVEGYRYVDGRWYRLAKIELYVEEGQAAAAEEAIAAAGAPFAPAEPAVTA